MAVKKGNKNTIKNPEKTLCDNFQANQDNSKKRCVNCKNFDNKNNLCKLKENSSVIREVLEFDSLDDSYNYTCKEQLSSCYSCSCFCKSDDDFYCDYGKFGLGIANRESITWKNIKSATESTCEEFKNRNPLGLSPFSSSYCENCRYFFKDKGCMKNPEGKLTKIKWKKIENPKFESCKLFEHATTNVRAVIHTNNDKNCYKCKYFNESLGCMNKKGKPKSSFKEITKPELHVCKMYKPSSLRKHNYKDSCLTCKFLIQGKGCVNSERKGLKDLKRFSPPLKPGSF